MIKAVIKTQGKQLTVAEGDILKVNRYPQTEAGSLIEIKDVLCVENGEKVQIGQPIVEGASVSIKILENKRADKVLIWKRKRRKVIVVSGDTVRNFRLLRSNRLMLRSKVFLCHRIRSGIITKRKR
jgi:large subunit ribosomal protein L21